MMITIIIIIMQVMQTAKIITLQNKLFNSCVRERRKYKLQGM